MTRSPKPAGMTASDVVTALYELGVPAIAATCRSTKWSVYKWLAGGEPSSPFVGSLRITYGILRQEPSALLPFAFRFWRGFPQKAPLYRLLTSNPIDQGLVTTALEALRSKMAESAEMDALIRGCAVGNDPADMNGATLLPTLAQGSS